MHGAREWRTLRQREIGSGLIKHELLDERFPNSEISTIVARHDHNFLKEIIKSDRTMPVPSRKFVTFKAKLKDLD
jgi:hypothetical protein